MELKSPLRFKKKGAIYFPTRSQIEVEIEVFGGNSGALNSEKFLISVASAWIKSGDFVMDVGANHGQHARLFAQMVGTNGWHKWESALF